MLVFLPSRHTPQERKSNLKLSFTYLLPSTYNKFDDEESVEGFLRSRVFACPVVVKRRRGRKCVKFRTAQIHIHFAFFFPIFPILTTNEPLPIE